jgi:hypothetical protein
MRSGERRVGRRGDIQSVLDDDLLGHGGTKHRLPIPIRSPCPRSRSGLALSFNRVDLLLIVWVLIISFSLAAAQEDGKRDRKGHTVRPHEMTQPSTPGVSLDPEPAVVSGRGGFEVALSVSAFETLEEGGLVVSFFLR